MSPDLMLSSGSRGDHAKGVTFCFTQRLKNRFRPLRSPGSSHHPLLHEHRTLGILVQKGEKLLSLAHFPPDDGKITPSDRLELDSLLPETGGFAMLCEQDHSTCFPVQATGEMNRIHSQVLLGRTHQTGPWTVLRRVANQPTRFVQNQNIRILEKNPLGKVFGLDQRSIRRFRAHANPLWNPTFRIFLKKNENFIGNPIFGARS